MSKGTQGLLLLFSLALLLSITFNYLSRRFFLASLLAGMMSAMGVIISGCIIEGHLDKFAAIAFVCGSSYAFLLSFAVGIVFRVVRGPPYARVCGGCEKCGYGLLGNESGICPECGTPLNKPVQPSDRDA